jgi:fused signal recognition particle receptor
MTPVPSSVTPTPAANHASKPVIGSVDDGSLEEDAVPAAVVPDVLPVDPEVPLVEPVVPEPVEPVVPEPVAPEPELLEPEPELVCPEPALDCPDPEADEPVDE